MQPPCDTVNVNVVLAASPLMVALLPDPLNEPDGLPVTVQLPLAGRPLKSTLPVATVHVG